MLLTAITLAAGCTGVPDKVERQAARDEMVLPYCAFDVTRPETLQGELIHNDVAHLDCVAPEPGPELRVGFAHDAWRAVVRLQRGDHRVGETVRIGEGAALFYQGADGYCTEWQGEVVWLGDLPSWGLFVNARCANAPIEVVAAWSGN